MAALIDSSLIDILKLRLKMMDSVNTSMISENVGFS